MNLYLERCGNLEIWMKGNGNLICEACGEFYRDGQIRSQTGDLLNMAIGEQCEARPKEGFQCIGRLAPCGRPMEDIERLEQEAKLARAWKRNGQDEGDKFGERMFRKLFTAAGQQSRRDDLEAREHEKTVSSIKGE